MQKPVRSGDSGLLFKTNLSSASEKSKNLRDQMVVDDGQNTEKPSAAVKNKKKQCIQHNYHDHSYDQDTTSYISRSEKSKGGVTTAFPSKLYKMLDHVHNIEPELAKIVSWQPHGRCFLVHKPKAFAENVLAMFFQQKKYASFQRQLNLYGFSRITKGPDRGSYYHELFLRGKEFLCRGIIRSKIKGTGARLASNPDAEPNFYDMPPVPSARDFARLQSCTPNEDAVSPSPATIVFPTLNVFTHEDKSNSKTDMIPLQIPSAVTSVGPAVPAANTLSRANYPAVSGYNNTSTNFSSLEYQPSQVQFDTNLQSKQPPKVSSVGFENLKMSPHNEERQAYPPHCLVYPSHRKTVEGEDLEFVFDNMPFHAIDRQNQQETAKHSLLQVNNRQPSPQRSCVPFPHNSTFPTNNVSAQQDNTFSNHIQFHSEADKPPLRDYGDFYRR